MAAIDGELIALGALGLSLAAAVVIARSRDAAAAMHLAREAVEVARGLVDLSPDEYLRSSALDRWFAENPDPRKHLLTPGQKAFLRDPEIARAYEDAEAILGDPRGWVRRRNESYVREAVSALDDWFDTRFDISPTRQQRIAVVTDEDCNLVVAGAGCGKTTTLLAKLAYLIEKRGVPPQEILVVAFNKAIAREIPDRLQKLGVPIPDVSTFHGKGFDILGQAYGRKPPVSALAEDQRTLLRFLEELLEEGLRDPDFRVRFTHWWVDLRVGPEQFTDCITPDERLRRERSLGLRTLDGTKVRSQSEVKVGDWLTLNGINWEYEARYPQAPSSPSRRDYTPDFFLPDHEVWIEVWACDEDEKDFPAEVAARRYRTEMHWKRALHTRNGTVLVEIFQNEIWNQTLGNVLAIKLGAMEVGMSPLPPDEVRELIESIEPSFAPIVRLLASFLGLFRAGSWTRSGVSKRARSSRDSEFLTLFWRFLEAYESALASEEKIDFDAMLTDAATALDGGHVSVPYRYILVDEFQDTSRGRLCLLQALRRDASSCQLFLVGDDWQSIYRFTGSDIGFFTHVRDHLGVTARTDLDTTFRLPPNTAALSSSFVTRNPAQLKKRLQPRNEEADTPNVAIYLFGSDEENDTLLEVLERIAGSSEKVTTVLLLARYNHLLSNANRVVGQASSRLRVSTRTVHSAKGLEADHVVIIGLESGYYGFPSEIGDDPVLDLLLASFDHYPNAEERRLFYVALTRARHSVHLLAPQKGPSPFIEELLGDEYADWISVYGEKSDRHRCPRCDGKTIRRREGRNGTFWGCINYPGCRGTLRVCWTCKTGVLEPAISASTSIYRCSNSKCSQTADPCPHCGAGILVTRKGPYGQFLGCTEWRRDGPGCDYTRSE